MTNEQILKKAIDKAVKNGWDKRRMTDIIVESEDLSDLAKELRVDYLEPLISIFLIFPESKGGRKVEICVRNLLFDHDFAKAFWGEDLVSKQDYKQEVVRKEEISVNENYEVVGVKNEDDIELKGILITMPIWKYHLQQLVLEEDPIKYLEQFL